MARTEKTITMIGIWLGLLLLSACSASTPTSTPTLDLDPFRTEVASTVLAQVTQALAQTPSVTPIPSSTQTPSPTATLAPSSTPAQPASASGTPGVPTTNQAEWVSQSIADGTVFSPGETFTNSWRLRNVGTSSWTASYLFRFYSGSAFGAPEEILLGQDVAPGETVEIPVAMTAPTTPGEYRSDWVLSDELGSNFNQPVYLEITVAAPATATPTAANTATPTATP